MKKILLALALILLTTPAFAGWNIKQKDTGGAVWENQDGSETPVGGGTLNVRIATLGTAVTEYIVAVKPGKITALYGVTMSPVSGSNSTANNITLWLEGSVAGQFTQVSGATIAMSSGRTAGKSTSDTSNIDEPASGSGDPDTDTVDAGQVIAVHTDGSGTGDTPAMITIIIE